ncbi:MAG: YdhR family protein [Kiloniellales bacterium]|nr:YdhR family protein [Kiloniellales bacterium]
MTQQAFVYTELQISVPFAEAPWRDLNPTLRAQPGLLNKTWLAGIGTGSLGGFYAFETAEAAEAFVTGYFPDEARRFGAAPTTRIFDARPVEEASRDMGSVHFGPSSAQRPGAFVYTEVWVSVPFAQAPWREINPVLKQQPGLLSKTWLSGWPTNTLGGIYAFDTAENARAFALDYFPSETDKLRAAYTARLFDAAVVEEASRDLASPFYA